MSDKRPRHSRHPSPHSQAEDPSAEHSSSTSRPGSNTAAAAGSIRSADYHVPRKEDKKLPKAQGIQRTASGRAISEGAAGSAETSGHAGLPQTTLAGGRVLVPDSQAAAVPSSHPEEDEDMFGFSQGFNARREVHPLSPITAIDWAADASRRQDTPVGDEDEDMRTERAASREQTPAVSVGISELTTPRASVEPRSVEPVISGDLYARRVSYQDCVEAIEGFDEDWAISAVAQNLSNVRYFLESGLLDFQQNTTTWVNKWDATTEQEEQRDHASFKLVDEFVALARVIENTGARARTRATPAKPCPDIG